MGVGAPGTNDPRGIGAPTSQPGINDPSQRNNPQVPQPGGGTINPGGMSGVGAPGTNQRGPATVPTTPVGPRSPTTLPSPPRQQMPATRPMPERR
jgi:hypothetical protein